MAEIDYIPQLWAPYMMRRYLAAPGVLERLIKKLREERMKITRQAMMAVVLMVADDAYCRQATKYLDDHTVVRCTRVGHWRKNGQSLRLWLGKPNYAERAFIKECKKAGEPFPVKKIQLKFYTRKEHR